MVVLCVGSVVVVIVAVVVVNVVRVVVVSVGERVVVVVGGGTGEESITAMVGERGECSYNWE